MYSRGMEDKWQDQLDANDPCAALDEELVRSAALTHRLEYDSPPLARRPEIAELFALLDDTRG